MPCASASLGIGGIGMFSSIDDALVRADAPGDGRRDVGGVDVDDVVVVAVRIGGEGAPARDGGVPVAPFGR